MKFTQEEAYVLSQYLRTMASVSEKKDLKPHEKEFTELAEAFEFGKVEVPLSYRQMGLLSGLSKQFVEYAATMPIEAMPEDKRSLHSTALQVFRNLKLTLEQM